jgi:hypothetical protein
VSRGLGSHSIIVCKIAVLIIWEKQERGHHVAVIVAIISATAIRIVQAEGEQHCHAVAIIVWTWWQWGMAAIATDQEDGSSNDYAHHSKQQSTDNKSKWMMKWVWWRLAMTTNARGEGHNDGVNFGKRHADAATSKQQWT